MSLIIRQLQPSDLKGALKVVSSHNADHAAMAERDLGEYFLQKGPPGNYFLCAEAEGEIVGIIGLYDDPDPDVSGICWGVWVYVDADHRGSGVGGRLMAAIEDEARRRKARKLYLDVGNEEDHRLAIEFYLKRGYVLEGTLLDYFTEGENKQVFALRL